NRGRASQDRAAAQHGTLLHHRAFVDTTVAAHEYVILDDHRHRAHRFKHASDLRGRGDVAVRAHLRTASHQRMRIDHGAVAHPCAYVDEHGRHAGDVFAKVDAVANARSTWNNPDAAFRREPLHGICGLVEERLAHRID